jgi:hypothetical protein
MTSTPMDLDLTRNRLRPITIFMLCALNICFGVIAGSVLLAGSGVVGLCYLATVGVLTFRAQRLANQQAAVGPTLVGQAD